MLYDGPHCRIEQVQTGSVLWVVEAAAGERIGRGGRRLNEVS